MRRDPILMLSLQARAYIASIEVLGPTTTRSSTMKLRRHPLILALAVCAAVAGFAALDVQVAVDLDRPFIATR
jgi:hypothetical protein